VTGDFLEEFARYKTLGRRAMEQVSDDALNQSPASDGNSIATLVHHISGNLVSRFTDFLDTDGEKEWRDRDAEFVTRSYTRREVDWLWERGWGVLERQLSSLSPDQSAATVHIRGQPLTVHQALCRSLAHTAYHVGQIVLLARMLVSGEWRSLSIPRGKSREFNQSLSEKSPR
jgi:uncharacterized damage-inducible protein DinB